MMTPNNNNEERNENAFTIEAIHGLWDVDSKIDDLELDLESLKIPQLHSKYMKIMNDENRILSRMMFTHKMLEKDKHEYYSGKMCEEDLEERNWKPLTLKILKGDVSKYVDGDSDIIQNLVMIADQREKCSLLGSIITSVNNRSFVITNAIKWKQFTNGING
jgi:hypothetical protein